MNRKVTDERTALLRAIIDDPEGDATRLVYADWIEEHGDPDRAEFIRVQVELAKCPHDPKRPAEGTGKLAGYLAALHRESAVMDAFFGNVHSCEQCLRQREQELWVGKRAGEYGWVAQLSADLRRQFMPALPSDSFAQPNANPPSAIVVFQRGFGESVISPADALPHLTALCEQEPVTRVRLSTLTHLISSAPWSVVLGFLTCFPRVTHWTLPDGTTHDRVVEGQLVRLVAGSILRYDNGTTETVFGDRAEELVTLPADGWITTPPGLLTLPR